MENVPEPKILNPHDAIIRITTTAICGSDLNLLRYMPGLLEKVQEGKIDPTFVISHRLNLSDAADGYETFNKNKDDCIKVVFTP